jgi:hypothetical protein
MGATPPGFVPYGVIPNCVTGQLTFATSNGVFTCVNGLPTATTSQLYGGTGTAGVAQAVTLGTGLALSSGTLSVSGGASVCSAGAGTNSVICGGGSGGANATPGTNGGAVGGYNLNAGSGSENFVAGGHDNTNGNGNVENVLIGGHSNSIGAFVGSRNAIVGGSGNTISNNGSNFIAAGDNNTASGGDGFVTGYGNSVGGQYNSVPGGSGNTATNSGGGRNGVGGYNNNCSSMDYASFVWAWQSVSCAGNYMAAFGASPVIAGTAGLLAGQYAFTFGNDSFFVMGGGRQGRGDNNGREQTAEYQINCQFSSTTACELKDNSSNRISINQNMLGYLVNIKIIGTDRTGHGFAVWTLTNALIGQLTTTASTAVASGNPVFVAGPTIGTFPTCGTVPTLTADTTNGALIVTGPICGSNSDNISLQAQVATVEVRGNF